MTLIIIAYFVLLATMLRKLKDLPTQEIRNFVSDMKFHVSAQLIEMS